MQIRTERIHHLHPLPPPLPPQIQIPPPRQLRLPPLIPQPHPLPRQIIHPPRLRPHLLPPTHHIRQIQPPERIPHRANLVAYVFRGVIRHLGVDLLVGEQRVEVGSDGFVVTWLDEEA